ncbi:MAG TPA: gfo/Idh/MocA family oxidoreductase [Verrucomicrobiota bacterium]|nr:gfo/Idh/MocA family oxidoreductase [Verrucomicrobiota bacterium]HNT13542.1 gfo/Idh/MocA family oxidoreductase [Verrucomicrobiota bacterium]
MKTTSTGTPSASTRREFLSTSARAAAGAALASAIATRAYAAENNTIKLALVGCGDRGTGATAQALSTTGPVKLWAMADFFADRMSRTLNQLNPKFAAQLDVPLERQFAGLEGFKQAIDALDQGDVVLLATPPAFRPIHVEYAVAKGVHVFMEKSFAVDAPGIRRVLKAGQLAAQKNLKIASGLMSRHYVPLEQAVEQIHRGLIGEVITCWANRMHGPVDFKPRAPGMTELAHQINNYSNFTWLNGTFFVDWLIHNIDVCCWIKNGWPVSVQGIGGRQVRTAPDQLFDHYTAEYTFADGTKMLAQGRHITKAYDFFGNFIQGATGCALLGEGQPKPRIFKGHKPASANLLWQYTGAPCQQYQREHDLFFDAIRNDRPYNETERSVKSCMTAIMGRMACESGQMISWEDAFNSNLELAPGLEGFTSDSSPPVLPDAHGQYPVARPGITRVL